MIGAASSSSGSVIAVVLKFAYGPLARAEEAFPMKIRAGYEISYDCPQPTPMILQLSVHPSRVADLLSADPCDSIRPSPPTPITTVSAISATCIVAPAGRLTMSTDFLVQDNGEPDPVAPQAEQHAARGPAGGDSDLSARQPLLRDRSAVGHRLVAVRATSEGWPLVQAICDYVHDHITFGYQHASADKTAWEAYTSGAACAATSPISPSPYAAA